MAGSQSGKKRQREAQRLEHRREKAVRREQRKQAQGARPKSENGEDPDLAGIVPGPQPVPEDEEQR